MLKLFQTRSLKVRSIAKQFLCYLIVTAWILYKYFRVFRGQNSVAYHGSSIKFIFFIVVILTFQ